MTPEATVVIATRNRGHYVTQALSTALAQQGVEFEVIVIDDASDDRTAFEGVDDERLTVLRNDEPIGAGPSRNRGIAAAKAPWVAFLDDDDLWSPHRLRLQLDAAGDAGYGYCGQVLVDPARVPFGTLPAPRPEMLPDALLEGSLIGGPSAVMVRKDVLDRVGGFAGRYGALDDWDLWLRVGRVARASAVPELLVAYTVHPGNMHLRDPKRVLADFDAFAAAHGNPEAGVALMEWIAAENHEHGQWRQAASVYLRSARRHRRAGDALRAAVLAVRRPGKPEHYKRPRMIGPPWLEEFRAA